MTQTVDPADRADARPAGPRPARSAKATRQRRKWFEIIGLTAPAFIVFSLFVLLPIGFAAYYSLFRWNGVGWPDDFRGLYYYFGEFGALRDPVFQSSLRNTGIILVGSLLVQGPVAIAIALLLNRKFRGRAVFRMLVFVPYVIAEVTVGVVFSQMLQYDGPANVVLQSLGLGPIDWLGKPNLRHLDDSDRPDLEVHRVRPHPLSGWVVERTGRALRGGRNRWRELVADPATHHPAAARPDDPDLGVPVDDRCDPGL